MVQPGSDNGQKSPTTGASSLAFQNSSSPNMFSLPSQKKTSPFGGIFDNKDAPGDSSKSTFQFGGNNGFSTPTNTPGDSSKSTFQFGGNNGFSTPTTPSIFSTTGSSFNMPAPTLFSMNQQPICTGSGNMKAAEASADADEGVYLPIC
ncbi:unnamed protein product [Triticum turgidum subsp. durum]|uniref:Uncharacterized protein n=1 Tax=Triticum turgidum subsp. durum TaxID=4567 RepID=A0A9R1RUZ7_TRITD|nr:unnamed protein product [Triticum turgidum subsp. durum]